MEDPSKRSSDNHRETPDRLDYVMPENAVIGRNDDEMSLFEIWDTICESRLLIITTTMIFASVSIIYAFVATEWYSADVLLAPSEEQSTQSLLGPLGGFANLAGINVGAKSTAEALAVLQSREFTRAFIMEENLMPTLLADEWDEKANRWKVADPSEWPDTRDAVKYLDENVRRIKEDPNTGLVTLIIEWTDPDLAAKWANLLVKRLNDRMRQRALVEAETNVDYLQAELAATNVVTLHQSISRLLEGELQKLMLARGNEEFSFRVVDPAESPKLRSRPQRTLIVLSTSLLGGMFSLFAVFVRRAVRRHRAVSEIAAS